MKSSKTSKLFFLLLLTWFAINILQSIFTEITNDEAYYALWGKLPDWGYFDHPPMVAVFTKISSIFFSGNLGVRFMTVLVQLATLWLMWKIIDLKVSADDSVVRYFAVAASVVMFTAYGFITTPDVPLLFFTALFLFAYQLFLRQLNWKNGLLLSIAMAGMIYSKYQAGLVIILVVLSNLKLLLNYKFWLSGILAIIMLLPHIFWQIQHDFPGFQYHMVDRSSGFKWKYFIEYLPNQLAVFNPFTLVAACWAIFSKRKKDDFERSLSFVVIGFLLFFWLTAFRGHVEPHWTIAAAVGMIVLIIREADVNSKLRKYISRFVYPSLILILIARILLITDILPLRLGFHSKEAKYLALQLVAENHPVIYTGSFQAPSLYRFFSGGEAQVVSSLYTRRTQFDIWKFEENYFGKKVFVMGAYDGRSIRYDRSGYTFEGFFTDSLQITNAVFIEYVLPKETFKSGENLQIPVEFHNKSEQIYDLRHSVFPAVIYCVLIHKDEMLEIPVRYSLNESVVAPGNAIEFDIHLELPEMEERDVLFCFALKSYFGLTQNSEFKKISVEK